MKRHIGIVGGSISGTALAERLISAGHRVSVLERSSSDLEDRGLGIAMDPMVAQTLGDDLGCSIRQRAIFDREGSLRWTHPLSKRTVRWSAVHHALASGLPAGVVETGTNVREVGSDEDRAWVEIESGERREFDLVVGADGIGSRVRRAVDPDFEPEYLGYVAIRGLVPIEGLPSEAQPVRDAILDGSIVNGYLDRSHVVLYAIESPTGELLVNWMWYRNTTTDRLDDLLGSVDGGDRRWSLPPGGIPRGEREAMRREATDSMPASLSSILLATESWSLQAIHGGIASDRGCERLLLIGDAARIAIPHIGAGTSMAITDARSLAEVLDGDDGELGPRLARWSDARRRETEGAMAFGRDLGRFLQFSGTDWTTWAPEDFDRWWSKLLDGRRVYFESPRTDG